MKTQVYFDGLCHLCSREIDHYRKMKGADKIEFIDITSSHFDALKAGLDPQKVHQVLHAIDHKGQLQLGVDAFFAIWSELDRLQWIVPIASKKPIRQLLNWGYQAFVQIRPYLPRKKCSDSPYCEIKRA